MQKIPKRRKIKDNLYSLSYNEENYSHKVSFKVWNDNGSANHVGIVEKVENNVVYTIEGNSTDDMCRQKEYSINSKFILGYGIP